MDTTAQTDKRMERHSGCNYTRAVADALKDPTGAEGEFKSRKICDLRAAEENSVLAYLWYWFSCEQDTRQDAQARGRATHLTLDGCTRILLPRTGMWKCYEICCRFLTFLKCLLGRGGNLIFIVGLFYYPGRVSSVFSFKNCSLACKMTEIRISNELCNSQLSQYLTNGSRMVLQILKSLSIRYRISR